MKAREELPNDTVELKGLVYQLLDVVEEQKKLIANLNDRVETQLQKNQEQAQQITQQSEQITAQSQKIEEQSQRIDQLTDQVNSLKRYRFGKKSEKISKEKSTPDNQQETQDTSPDANIGLMMDAFWTGLMSPDGVRDYTLESYTTAVMIIPLCATLGACLVAVVGIRQNRNKFAALRN